MSIEIDIKFGSKLSMSIDYGFSSSGLSDYINSLPIDIFYQD